MAAKILRTAAAVLALALAVPAFALQPDEEGTMRARVQQAVWPADIVLLSSQYLANYPRSAWAEICAGLRERAGAAMSALGTRDVQLYRSAFVSGSEANSSGSNDVRQAALGDQTAALRMAHMYLHGDGVATDLNRYVGWLQYATKLGNRDASYELAVYYRRQDQPALASQYEARAVEMGFNPPRWLDHVRK